MSFTNVHGTRFHTQVLGSGEGTVVFLHGLVMDNLSSWFFTAASQTAKFARVVLYDLRGHGMSDRPPEDYTVETHVRDLDGLLTELGVRGPVVLVGNSFGGLLALNYAHAYPSRVRGMVLVDAQLNDEAWKQQMARSLSLEGAERDQKIAENFKNWLGRESQRKSHRLAQHAEALVTKTSLIRDLQRSMTLNRRALEAIAAPTLAIYGAGSDILTTGLELASALPNAELMVFDGCTHSVLWERTEEVKALLIDRCARFLGVASS